MMTRIRPLAPRHKSVVMRILRNSPEFEQQEVQVAEEIIDAYLHDAVNSGYHIAVAEIDSDVEGYICYGPTPLTKGTWDIYWIAVSPQKKGLGIGKELMYFAEDSIKRAEGRLVLIETSSKPLYENSRIFYQKRDYELICRIADFYAPKDDKLIYLKRI
jgi:ribosomal protein S18 acetylase RimI-like enzyme